MLFAMSVFAEHQGYEFIERLPVVVEAVCALEKSYPCEVRIDSKDNKKNVYLTIYVKGKLKYIFIYEEGWIIIYDSKFDL